MARKRRSASERRRARKEARKKAEDERLAAEAEREVEAPDATAAAGERATAGGHAEEPAAEPPRVEDPAPSVVDDEEGPIAVDVEADLDPDSGAADAVEQLIAETLATAGLDEGAAKPEKLPIDLDEGAGSVPTGMAKRSAAQEAVRALIDLGPVSSPEVRDRLLAQALAHAEHQDARYRVPFAETRTAARWKGLLATMLLLLAAVIAVAPPRRIRPEPAAELGAAARSRSLQVALLLQAQQVEAFRVRLQRLPATLDEVAVTLPGVRYVRSGNRAYQLIAYRPDGTAIVYDSADPTPAFDAIAVGWAAEAGQP